MVRGSRLSTSVAVALVPLALLASACSGGTTSGQAAASTTTTNPTPTTAGVTSTTSATSGGQQLVLAAGADAVKAPSLHYDWLTTFKNSPAGTGSIDIAGDVTAHFGVQVITWTTSRGRGVATVELTSENLVYFKATTASMLEGYFQTPAAQARSLAGKWIQVTPSAGAGFQNLSAALTVSSVMQQLTSTGPYSPIVPATLGSTAVR